MIERQAIVDAARGYLGVPFKKGGRDKRGIDCVGLLICAARDVGIELDDTTRYSFDPEVPLMQEYVLDQSIRVPILPIKNGYIAILRQAIFPMHTGIMTRDTGATTIINANIKLRKVVEQPFAEWTKELIMFRDYKGIA